MTPYVVSVGPADGLVLNDPFALRVDLVVSLAYLSASGAGVDRVVAGVKQFAAGMLSDVSTSATIAAADVATAIAQNVLGVAEATCSFGPAGEPSFVGQGGAEPYLLVANNVVVDVRTID